MRHDSNKLTETLVRRYAAQLGHRGRHAELMQPHWYPRVNRATQPELIRYYFVHTYGRQTTLAACRQEPVYIT